MFSNGIPPNGYCAVKSAKKPAHNLHIRDLLVDAAKEFERCPAGRPGTADEIANVAELLIKGHSCLNLSYRHGILLNIE